MKDIKKENFLEQIKSSGSEIVYLSIVHILEKKFTDVESIKEDELLDFFANYKNYHLYLNDYAGVIYNRYASSIDQIYIQMCEILDISVDNKYTLEHVIMKLEKQTPSLLLGLTDADIQKQTIEHFDEKIESIESSTHYNANMIEYKDRIEKLKQNISLVKNALQIS